MASMVYFAGGNSLTAPDSLKDDTPNTSIFYRDHVVMWVKDVRRTLDYLATRPDIDSTRFASYSISFEGRMAGLVPAVEPRLKAVVVVIGGLVAPR